MMKKYFLSAAIALIGLASCNKETDTSFQESNGSEAYMQVSVQLPTPAPGTMSPTGSTTEEVGQAYENNVTSLTVYLEPTAVGGSIIKIPVETGGTTTTGAYTTNPFPVTGLTAGASYKVYVVINDSPALSDMENDAKTLNKVDLTAVTSGINGIATPNAFLMTNAEAAATKTLGGDLNVYTKAAPFDLGAVKVERAAARFDYKQGVIDDKHTVNGTTITIQGAALINVSNSFYYFRRVSDDGKDTNAALGGAETASNYVVDHNFAGKTKTSISSASGYFMNYMKAPAAAPYGGTYTDLSTLTTGTGTGAGEISGYKLWTYCPENTIQADPKVNQINGLSTGIVFKALITGHTKFNGTDKVYIFNNKVIGHWSDVWTSVDVDVKNAIAAANASSTIADHLIATESSNTCDALAKAGFTRYTPDGNGDYYAYYIYWNRHNDNGVSSEMGPMEFAVVRNNVYKLSVSKINKFGHPNDPINPNPVLTDPDPDQPKPENSDEDSNVYMQVEVQILPWTVRVNDIEF